MKREIRAEALQRQGIGLIESTLIHDSEALVTVRGKGRYVIMDIDRYLELKEGELAAALIESREDMKAGRFVESSARDHLEALKE
jgi:hypothetical protein